MDTAMKLDLTLFLQDASEERIRKINFMPQPSSKDTNTWSRTLEGSSTTSDNMREQASGTLVGTRRSTTGSIPLPSSHVHRTQSEVQLSLDEEAAERRDTSMFYRLVNGIRERQHVISHDSSTNEHVESVRSITGILHTRLANIAPGALPDAGTLKSHDEEEDSESHGLTDATNDEVPRGAGGWSITGYNHNPAANSATMATDALDKEANDDDCIFDLDF
jgi:hypothetical protein